MTELPPVADPTLRQALVGHLRRRLPPRDVEDVVQAALAEALVSPTAPSDRQSLERWLYGVARNKAVDLYRKRRREQLGEPSGHSAPVVPDDAERVELVRWLERELPEGEDAVRTLQWMLREGEGEKLEKIAEEEAIPAARVRKRVSRLRQYFKARWAVHVAAAALITGAVVSIWLWRQREEKVAHPLPAPSQQIAPEEISDRDRALAIRKRAVTACDAEKWVECKEGLDEAKQLDPAGDTAPEVVRARDTMLEKTTPKPPVIGPSKEPPPAKPDVQRPTTPRPPSSATPSFSKTKSFGSD